MFRRVGIAASIVLVFAATTALRFLATVGFSDDHYVHLAGAQQMWFGEWPTHDFVDLGMPLMFAVSAAARGVFGPTLLTEAVLVAVAFGLAAALTLKAALDVSGSLVIALGAVAFEVAIYPRSYSYPKVLLYVVGVLAMWRYADRPSTARLAQLAVVVVIAFLMRHDHGLYLGIAGFVAVLLVDARDDIRRAVRRVVSYVGLVALMSVPYVIYLASGAGLMRHVAAGLSLREVEKARTQLPWVWFRFDQTPIGENAVPWLYYLFYTLPILAVALAWWRPSMLRRDRMVPLAVLALLANVGMLRDSLWVRLPDAVAPAALLLAALLGTTFAWHTRWARAVAGIIACVVIVITAWSADVVGSTREQLNRAGLYGGFERLPNRVSDRAAELRARLSPRQVPSPIVHALFPFFAYADRCLAAEHFVLTPGFMSEVPVWTARRFAGGQIWYQPGVLASAADHRLVMDRLARQRVPVAITRTPEFEGLASTFPELGAYVTNTFTTVATFDSTSGLMSVRVNPRLATGHDAETGWPCFR